MGMTKCISGNQQTYSVGDPITFKIVISNHGALGYSGNLTDFLGLAQQNLSLVNGSVTYAYGVAAFNPYSTTPGCIDPVNLPFQTQPSWVTVTQQTQQNLEWNISGMPGSCELEKANYLVIHFTATILPQSFGRYHNTATIGTISADAYYNIMRVAKIVTTKTASTAFVELGQQFSYIVNVKNAGSVAIDNIKVEDALPGCATIDWCTANKLNASGVIISTGVPLSCNPPNFTFNPTFTLQPGESIELSIVVTRNANNQDPQCCNPKAKGIGRTTDAVHQWPSDEDGPACVKSSLCCDIKDLNVMFWTNHINGAIVPAFWITSGPVPVQEVDISLMDYHIEYNHPECKPVNIGNLSGHIQPFVGTYGGNWNFYNLSGVVGASPPTLPLQTVINPVNNILTWTGSNPINFSGAFNTNGIVGMNFIAPGVVNLDCCSGKVFYCFKVRVKDVNCNVCEKIVCGSSELPKRRIVPWTNVQAQGKYEIESLKNIERTIQKPEVNKGQNNFGAPGHKKDTIPSKKKN